jgi:predicted outer membrane repeat protein
MNAPAGGTHDGTSWPSAYLDLQQALTAAVSGDELHVADGVYKPTVGVDRNATFALKSGVSLLGGYEGYAAADPSLRSPGSTVTTLSGDIGTAGDNSDNSYHVVSASSVDATAVLDGFTVTAGNSTGSTDGGGMNLTASATLTINNCTFTADRGGAVISNSNSSPTFNDCTISNNTTLGLVNFSGSPILNRCTFTGNTPEAIWCLGSITLNDCAFANDGSAIEFQSTSTATLSGCSFAGNFVGLYLWSGTVSLTNCTFSDNGCAIFDAAATSSPGASVTATNCSFSGNHSTSTGAAIRARAANFYTITCTGCSFVGNTAATDGAAIYTGNSVGLKVLNCSFVRNVASGRGGAIFSDSQAPSATNCTFMGNRADAGGGAVYVLNQPRGSTPVDITPSFLNCTFVGNRTAGSGSSGGAVQGRGTRASMPLTECSPIFIGCTFVSNFAGTGGAIYGSFSHGSVTNSIVWENSPSGGQIYMEPGFDASISKGYSDVQNDTIGGTNIDADPLFIRNPSAGADGNWGTSDDDYGDLRLRITSPCIDAASNAAIPASVTSDVAGNNRTVDVPGAHDPGAIVDMGAYEYQLPLSATTGTFLVNAAKPSAQVSFNGDVSPATLTAGDLLLTNLTSNQPIDTSLNATVSYDPATRSAIWQFPGLLPDGNYHATLAAGSVSDPQNDLLAADYSVDFFSLAGDANHDRVVDVSDLGVLATNWQGSGKNFSEGDFNYDGVVDVSDLGILATNWQKSLPAPAARAIRSSDATVLAPVSAPTTAIKRSTTRAPSLANDVLA